MGAVPLDCRERGLEAKVHASRRGGAVWEVGASLSSASSTLSPKSDSCLTSPSKALGQMRVLLLGAPHFTFLAN